MLRTGKSCPPIWKTIPNSCSNHGEVQNMIKAIRCVSHFSVLHVSVKPAVGSLASLKSHSGPSGLRSLRCVRPPRWLVKLYFWRLCNSKPVGLTESWFLLVIEETEFIIMVLHYMRIPSKYAYEKYAYTSFKCNICIRYIKDNIGDHSLRLIKHFPTPTALGNFQKRDSGCKPTLRQSQMFLETARSCMFNTAFLSRQRSVPFAHWFATGCALRTFRRAKWEFENALWGIILFIHVALLWSIEDIRASPLYHQGGTDGSIVRFEHMWVLYHLFQVYVLLPKSHSSRVNDQVTWFRGSGRDDGILSGLHIWRQGCSQVHVFTTRYFLSHFGPHVQ